MNMCRFLSCCIGALLVLASLAQEPIRIKGPFDTFTTDEMGNVYALQGDVLTLYNVKGVTWLKNSLKTFGRITALDAFYSLKPMVFSEEQGQMALLDNTLSLQGSVVNLPRNGFPQVVLACVSVQNSSWFFDQRDLALIRVDAQLRQLANTGRLDQLLGITPSPTSMLEFDSRLYVNDSVEGILVFDLFGTYAKTIPLKGVKSFEVRGEVLYYFTEEGFFLYDMRSFDIVAYPLPTTTTAILDARVERGSLYVLTAEGLEIHPVPTKP